MIKLTAIKCVTLLAALIKVLQVIQLFWVVTADLSLGLPHPKR